MYAESRNQCGQAEKLRFVDLTCIFMEFDIMLYIFFIFFDNAIFSKLISIMT